MIVEIVSLEQAVWTGTARMVRVRTSEGDIGILPGHEAVAGILKPGDFAVDPVDGSRLEPALFTPSAKAATSASNAARWRPSSSATTRRRRPRSSRPWCRDR